MSLQRADKTLLKRYVVIGLTIYMPDACNILNLRIDIKIVWHAFLLYHRNKDKDGSFIFVFQLTSHHKWRRMIIFLIQMVSVILFNKKSRDVITYATRCLFHQTYRLYGTY